MNILLPWPSKDLSPNARLHWSRKARAVKIARLEAWEATYQAIHRDKFRVEPDTMIDLYIEFHPSDRRRHDLDNCLARCKGYLDGIADALKINDRFFRLHIQMGDAVKGGQVSVTIGG